MWNPPFCQPPLTTPLCFATATLKRLKSAFRHPPHLAGVLDSLQQLLHASRGGLPPPPSSAGLRHSTDPFHGLPTDRPWTCGSCPSEPSWHHLARLEPLLFAVLGVFGGSCSLQMPFKRVLHWKLAGNRPSKCSARALRGPCTLLKPSKTPYSRQISWFLHFAKEMLTASLLDDVLPPRCLGRAPVDALRPSWAIFGASWGALGLFFGCFGLPNSPQKSQSLPKPLKFRKKIASGYVLGSTAQLGSPRLDFCPSDGRFGALAVDKLGQSLAKSCRSPGENQSRHSQELNRTNSP